MCGIVGHISIRSHIDKALFGVMCDTIAHRGPDDAGLYFSSDTRIALGHRRLSFLDLSERGRQPMSNGEGTIWLTFNGEIYNFKEIRRELESAYSFKTGTDSEVIIAGYKRWGYKVLDKLKGMFAFGLYDTDRRKLFLARDRFGIKPLYYYQNNDQFIFGSEIKAILASNVAPKDIDFSSFTDYFVYRYIPSPKTIWQDIKKLPAAHYLEVDVNSLHTMSKEYWTLGHRNQNINEKELIEEIDQLILRSVKQHTVADVPIGSFLSGGYDSSALVYYAKRFAYDPHTFSIGFARWHDSEHKYAKVVADSLGLKNKVVVADGHSLDLLSKMAWVYDEPIADISIIPTYIVSQLARTDVKAVLSGEGADELFGGYSWQKDFFDLQYPTSWKDRAKRLFTPTDTVEYYANAMAMGCFNSDELKEMLNPNLHQYIADDVHWFYRQHYDEELSPLKSIQKMDIKCFMGELVLTKIDRASMANSLEVRVPFLDHELFERIFSVSERNYFKQGITKYVLHENLKAHFPARIMKRKKQGFVWPDSYYMDIDWYNKHLRQSEMVEHGIVNKSYIDKQIAQKHHWKLWKLTIMEKWFAHYIG